MGGLRMVPLVNQKEESPKGGLLLQGAVLGEVRGGVPPSLLSLPRERERRVLQVRSAAAAALVLMAASALGVAGGQPMGQPSQLRPTLQLFLPPD